MAVFVFGDSHAHYIFGRCPEATTFWLGPRTMHRVGRDGAAFVPHLADLTAGDAVILVFGEIDVRCHLARIARQQGRPVEVVIGELVDRYVVATRATVEHFDVRARVFLLGVPPPMDAVVPNPELPVHGPLAERIAVRSMLNTVLAMHARTHGIGFVPVPALYENPDGSMRTGLSDGHAHIAMDHVHHACRHVGAHIGTPLTVRRPPPVERLLLKFRRHRAFRRGDAAALWSLGRLEDGGRSHPQGPLPAPSADAVIDGAQAPA